MIKILVMDDEPGLRNIVHNIIKPLGHQVFTAEDGHQALEIAKRENPAVALLDVRVPDMDGLQVLAELKKLNPDIKAIMLSGFGDVESAVFALKQGAFDYISKPFRVDDITKTVSKAISALGQKEYSGNYGGADLASPSLSGRQAFNDSVPVSGSRAVLTKTLLGIIAGSAIFLAAAGFFWIQKGRLTQLNAMIYALPYSNPIAISWTKPYLWVSDRVTGNIYQHKDDAALSIVAVYKTANIQPTGIAFDGQSLWTSNASEKKIFRHRMDTTLTVKEVFQTPDNNPAGIYFDAGFLWVLDANSSKIYKYNIGSTLAVVKIFDSPALTPCGMFREGEYFYLGDYRTSILYKILVNDFSVKEKYFIKGFEEGQNKLTGLAWDGSNILATADGVGKVFKIQLKSLKSIKS